MKFITFFLSMLILLVSSHSVSSLTDDLIAYWSFDDLTANDHSGNGYHGTIMYTPKFVNGVRGKAIWFEGRGYYAPTKSINRTDMGDHVLLPYIDFNTLSEFTVSMWVKEEGMSSPGGEGYFWFGHVQENWLGILNHVYYGQNQRFLHSTVGSYDTDDCVSIQSDNSFVNKWIFYLLVYQNGILKVYIDGKFIDERTIAIDYSNKYAALGRHWWFYGGEERTSARFTGAMDEVKIYNRALDDDEIEREFELLTIDFQLPDTTAVIGDNICIPLSVSTNNEAFTFDSLNYKIKIGYEKSVLWPTDGNQGVIDTDLRELELEGTINGVSNTPKEINYFCGTTLLANQSTTPLIIEEITIDNPNISVRKDDGSITISGICKQDLSRVQIDLIPEVRISNSLTDNSVNVRINSQSSINVKYSLYNILGNKVRSLSVGMIDKGITELAIDITELPIGTYFIDFQLGASNIIEKIFVNK